MNQKAKVKNESLHYYFLALEFLSENLNEWQIASLLPENLDIPTIGGDWILISKSLINDFSFYSQTFIDELGDFIIDATPKMWPLLKVLNARSLRDSVSLPFEHLRPTTEPNIEKTNLLRLNAMSIGSLIAATLENSVNGGASQLAKDVPKLMQLHELQIYDLPKQSIEVEVALWDGPLFFSTSSLEYIYSSVDNFILLFDENEDFVAQVLKSLFNHFLDLEKDIDNTTKILLLSNYIKSMHPDEVYETLKNNGLVSNNLDFYNNLGEIALITVPEIVSQLTSDENSVNDELDYQLTKVKRDNYEPLVTLENKLDEIHEEASVSKEMEVQPKRKSWEPNRNTAKENTKAKRATKRRKRISFESRYRSGRGYAHTERQEEESGLTDKRVEKAGIDAIVRIEMEEGRSCEVMPPNNEGFDLISTSLEDPSDIRYIELKSIRKSWTASGVGLTHKQIEHAQQKGEEYWLYVVENAFEEEASIRVHRIHNPWSRVVKIYFDDGWREIAEIDRYQNPPELYIGLSVMHLQDGLGELVKFFSQGPDVHVQIKYNNNEIRTYIWDDDVMWTLVN